MGGLKRKIRDDDGDHDGGDVDVPSLKDLASSDPSLRRNALVKIQLHLQSRPSTSPFTSTQTEQIWRAFYVLLYMHDSKNALSVQTVIATLAATFNTIREKDQQNESNEPEEADSYSSDRNDPVLTTNNDDDEFTGFDDDSSANQQTSQGQQGPNLEEKDIDSSWLSTYTLAFWSTMIREWPNIDSHRLNKYLLLVRFVLRQLFAICIEADMEASSTSHATEAQDSQPNKSKKSRKIEDDNNNSKNKNKSNKTNSPTEIETEIETETEETKRRKKPTKSQALNLIKSQTSILANHPLHPRNSRIPNGLRLHIIDIYTEEMEKAVAIHQTEEVTQLLFKQPLELLAATAMDKTVRRRAKDEITSYEEKFFIV